MDPRHVQGGRLTTVTDDAPRPARTILYRGGRIHTPADPFATAMLTDGDTIAWVGCDAAATHLDADTVIDLDDALITPAFVDAHVHTTATGLALSGLDLTGTPTRAAALCALTAHTHRHPTTTLFATGWDETTWTDDPRPPTATDLDRAAGGAVVYLARVDGHSAVISSALAAASGAPHHPGWHPDGTVTGHAHHLARRTADATLTPTGRRDAWNTTRTRAAALGIVALHEMAGPDISSADDLAGLLAHARAVPGPDIVGYWAGDIATAVELGTAWGGDAFVDGSLGSHTAALHTPYADTPHIRATTHLDADTIRDAVLDCADAGLQAGFHAIGDAAITTVLDGLEAAATTLGHNQITAARHRLEHAEMTTPDHLPRIAALGLVASVQPAFDARWGGENGMYATRLGPTRAAAMNPFAAMNRAGIPLAFSSDAPVTPLDPWGAIRAAVTHHTPTARLSARAAFTAATRGGWRAARADTDGHGTLAPGAPATYAVWAVPGELVAQVPDDRIAAWSTDPRGAVAALPDLSAPAPTCLRTVLRGRILHDTLT
ncbi:amidohydrolase [Frankia sp. BMG5.23]|uniref:amidohydrolase n=1 Tax=Frankia sp. BMG5.23 TaxID=683305 RepID=UPI000461296F|nr:amidohydrolase family protein [Frankia sp. BMG5.23]KDA42513.1 putative TIM-barrel fold metal-dependent hydrolase [Frankia sp. BMG5.23]